MISHKKYGFCSKLFVDFTKYFGVRANLTFLRTVHSVEITENFSHAFLTKISWNQRFYLRSY